VYLGDVGSTQPGRPSRRRGVEWAHEWTSAPHWRMDANVAWTRPRYSDSGHVGNDIPNAVQKMAHVNLTMNRWGPWSGSLGIRYIGAAPLVEDRSIWSDASTTANLRIHRRVSKDLETSVDVLNLTNRKNNDITYFYRSRLMGEPSTGVEGKHVHPAEPRSIRWSVRSSF
jgi:outer membrane receptor protein involved in Fe transport